MKLQRTGVMLTENLRLEEEQQEVQQFARKQLMLLLCAKIVDRERSEDVSLAMSCLRSVQATPKPSIWFGCLFEFVSGKVPGLCKPSK